jgi:hypothetical protein
MTALYGCKQNDIVAPGPDTSFSGQYQNGSYGETGDQPYILLFIAQEDSKIVGEGYFNSIFFSFTGSLTNNHLVIYFDLLYTNFGDLKNCNIEGYFNSSYVLTGAYTLILSDGNSSQKIELKKMSTK